MRWAGFLAGAGLAAMAVWLFYAVTTVSDDDLLSGVLTDHCLPYVTARTVPFEGLGRVPGVYDDVELRDGVQNGGTRLIHDGRFVAQWGEFDGLRFCEVKPTFRARATAAFEVEPDSFIPRYTALIDPFGTLAPEVEALTEGPRSIGWYGMDRARTEGLRVIMVASPGLVSSVIAVAPVSD